MTTRDFGSKAAVTLAFAALSSVVGCADLRGEHIVDPPRLAYDESEAEVLEQRAPSAGPGAANANGIAVAAVGATGPGCPAGSWSMERVPEGNAFTINFNSYFIEAPATGTPATKTLSCTFNLQLRAPKNLSYAVAAIQYFGYANLAAGMKAYLASTYTFRGHGNPVSREFRHDFPIPSASTYALNDQVTTRSGAAAASAAPVPALGWAPCDYASNLQVRTRLTIESTSHDRPGILALDNIDARSTSALKVVLQTGGCPSDR